MVVEEEANVSGMNEKEIKPASLVYFPTGGEEINTCGNDGKKALKHFRMVKHFYYLFFLFK